MKELEERNPLKLWEDSIHGITAYARKKITAWGIIRNKCATDGLIVPTVLQIKEVNPRPESNPIH